MIAELRRSSREYGRELVGGFQSLVAGAILEVLALVGIFWTDARDLHILGVIGVALGVIAAPFLAFHRMRLQRDAALSQGSPFARVRFANALSTGNWAIDSFGGTNDDGIAARAIVAAEHGAKLGADLTSSLAAEVVEHLQTSAAETFLSRLADQPARWELVTPTNQWIITAKRDAVPLDDAWEVYARCIVQLPRSFGGRFPVAAIDVFLRPRRTEAVVDAQYNPSLSPTPEGRARLDLRQVRDLLAALATTAVNEIADPIFPHIVELPQRRRHSIRSRAPRLRIAGPNLELRSRPRTLSDVLVLPDLPRRDGAPDTNQVMAETPGTVDAHDPAARDDVIVQALIRCLRQLEFARPELYEAELQANHAAALAERRAASA